jgi:hypothetical protein
MKTIKKSIFSTFAGLFCICLGAFAGTDLQKTYTWNYNINKDATVSFDNYDCNLTVHVWDKAAAEYRLTVDARTTSAEDAATLDRYLTSLTFTNSATSVSFKSTFWEKRNSIMGRTTMTVGGKKISLSEMSIKGEVWIPASCVFRLDSKYSEITMEDFAGQLYLTMYNDKFYGGNVSGRLEIEDKYSSMEFRQTKDIRADLYNSVINGSDIGNLNAISKYSKIKFGAAQKVEIDSYNDKYRFTKTGDLKLLQKYTDLTAEASASLDLDCYEGSVAINDAMDVKLNSKYGDYRFTTLKNITIESAYNDKFSAGKAMMLKIGESKYCDYRIDELAASVTETDGYEDKFEIKKVSQDFKELSINGKYIHINIGLPKSMDYRFRAKIQYPALEMNESQYKLKTKVIDGSNLQYDAVKGTEKDGMPLIEVNGYEVGLKIIDL